MSTSRIAKDEIISDPNFCRILASTIIACLQRDADRLPKDFVVTNLARKALIKWVGGGDVEKLLLPLRNSLTNELNRARQNQALWEQAPDIPGKIKPLAIPRIYSHVGATSAIMEFAIGFDEGKLWEAMDFLASLPSVGDSEVSMCDLVEGIGRIYSEEDPKE